MGRRFSTISFLFCLFFLAKCYTTDEPKIIATLPEAELRKFIIELLHQSKEALKDVRKTIEVVESDCQLSIQRIKNEFNLFTNSSTYNGQSSFVMIKQYKIANTSLADNQIREVKISKFRSDTQRSLTNKNEFKSFSYDLNTFLEKLEQIDLENTLLYQDFLSGLDTPGQKEKIVAAMSSLKLEIRTSLREIFLKYGHDDLYDLFSGDFDYQENRLLEGKLVWSKKLIQTIHSLKEEVTKKFMSNEQNEKLVANYDESLDFSNRIIHSLQKHELPLFRKVIVKMTENLKNNNKMIELIRYSLKIVNQVCDEKISRLQKQSAR